MTRVALLVLLLGLLGASGFAQDKAQDPDINAVVEMLRSDLKTVKIAAINETMKLSESEGQKFWPIFRQYDAELLTLGDQRVALIRDFAAAFGTPSLTNEKARDLSKRWLQVQQSRLDLWKKYQGTIESQLSPVRAAQFLQIEHTLALLVDLKIASELPVVELGPAQP